MTECLSHFVLVRFASDDLSTDDRNRVQIHLDECQTCRQRLEQIRARFEEFEPQREDHLRAVFDDIEKSPTATHRERSGRPVLKVIAIAAAVVLGLAIWQFTPRVEQEDIRYKGELAVKVVAKRGDRQFVAKDGQMLRAGDTIRFVFTASGPGFLSVFSRDSRGVVSQYYPRDNPSKNADALPIQAAGVHTLPGAVQLDDTPGQEIVIAVFSKKNFARDQIQKKVIPLLKSGQYREIKSQLKRSGLQAKIWRFNKPAKKR